MKRTTYFALGAVVVAVLAAVLVRAAQPAAGTVTVVHWSNSHLMRPELLPAMAEQFNAEHHTTSSGKRIKVEVVPYDSVDQVDDVEARLTGRGPRDRSLPDPTIITPQAEHWLSILNAHVGRTVVDAASSPTLARTVVGIVTYKDMAECLGWPAKPLGYADVIALRDDPAGWSRYPGCAKAEWGKRPLVAFTNPRTSTTGRSVLISLYSMATGKPPEHMTVADVEDPRARAYVSHFASLVDHYYPGTIPLNTKVYQGPKFGQFFLMPEDNLIRLYKGHEKANVNGQTVEAPPIDEPMVMIYPKEGATWHSHPAAVVDAGWVSDDQRDGAEEWIGYLRSEDRQQRFLAEGFRPGTDLALASPIDARFGVDPSMPETALRTNRTDPAVIAKILDSWGDVKRQAVVTFVVDTSGSMRGQKIEQARSGLLRALDVMATQNQVGLVAFSDTVHTRITPGAKDAVKADLAEAVDALHADGGTALYDAIQAGIDMSDSAAAPDDAIRAVVILSDGLASCDRGQLRLDDLFEMRSRGEVAIANFDGTECNDLPRDARGQLVTSSDVVGIRLKGATAHPVQIFFVGVGAADLQVGRIIAEATGAEYQGTPEAELATVLEAVSDYF